MKVNFLLLLALFFYSGVHAQFGDQLIISENALGAFQVSGGDIDGDGDLDVISASVDGDKVLWHENTDGLGNFDTEHIVSENVDGANDVFAVDIDGDGDLDIVSSSSIDNKVAWHENTDGNGTFTEHIISSEAAFAVSVFAVDIDGDGDVDVLSSSWNDDKISWYQNTDGLGNFGPQINILTDIDAAKIFCADFDGDGDIDLLYTSYWDDSINWKENLDGFGNFGVEQIITVEADGAQTVFAADIDGDGDMDALSASTSDNKIAWYENIDGLGNFGEQQVISINASAALRVFAADLDGDGDMDVISASSGDDKIAWYENTDGLGDFGEEQIISTNALNAVSVYAGDLDGDGDLDVLSASSGDNKIAWYKNSTLTLSIVENASFTFSAYPIPTISMITIQSKNDLRHIEIYNQAGLLILEERINDRSELNSINISKLSQGIYFVKGIDQNGSYGIKKIVKE